MVRRGTNQTSQRSAKRQWITSIDDDTNVTYRPEPHPEVLQIECHRDLVSVVADVLCTSLLLVFSSAKIMCRMRE